MSIEEDFVRPPRRRRRAVVPPLTERPAKRRRRRLAPPLTVDEAPQEVPDEEAYASSIQLVDRETLIIERYKERIKNRGTAIRAFCIECMGGQIAEVRRCGVEHCPLYPFRMGGNPFSRRGKT